MFEQDTQDDMTLNLMRNGAIAATQVPETLGRLRASYALEARTIAWFVLDKSTINTQEPPTEEALRSFYSENITGFSQPERRAIDLLKFSAEDYTGRVEVSETEIEAYYEASKAERFSEPESRTLATLIFPDEASAKAAFGSLAGGAPVTEVASATSAETRSVKESELADPTLATAMFGEGRQTGAIFGPMQIAGGWQITRLEGITPGNPYGLDLAHDVIRNELVNQRAQAMYYDVLGEIDNFIGAGMTLEEIGKEAGAPVISYLPVDANGIAEDGRPFVALLEAGEAFQQAFRLNTGDIGDRYDSDTHTFIAKTAEIIDANTPAFEDVSERIGVAYALRAESDALQSAADTISARLASNETTLESEAETVGAEVDRPPFALTRTNAPQSGLPEVTVSGIFAATEGRILTYPTRNRDQILILQVEKIDRPSDEELRAIAADAAISLSPSVEQDMQAALEGEIRTAIGFEPNPAALAAYKAALIDTQ
jgi:peptidyl-prolyl cis-trans isomerase D